MKSFFLDKFEYDYFSNLKWIETLTEYEDALNPFILKSFSHLVNVHHRWISRMIDQPSESDSWDLLPIDYWTALCQDNYRKTIDYLEHLELNEKVNYHSEEGVKMTKDAIDILYHILNHSNYHRAQISREMRILGITPPSFNFIAFR